MHLFDEMQFVWHCYTVVSYQMIFRHSMHKKSAVYLSSARVAFFARYVNSIPRLLKNAFIKTRCLLAGLTKGEKGVKRPCPSVLITIPVPAGS